MAKSGQHDGQSAGIQSLDAALRVLDIMCAQDGVVSLTDLARLCDMPPSKVHRYLASFMNAGYVEQKERSGKYGLGPSSVRLGLSAIGRHDFVNGPSAHLPDLRDKTGLTVLLSVYGTEGATVVRWERAASPVVTSMGLGTILPLLNSSTGRVFLAWGPQEPIRATLTKELHLARKNKSLARDFAPDAAGIEVLRRKTREQGYAAVDGTFIPGLVATAAPILDWQGEAQAAVTLIGTEPKDIEAGSDANRCLIDFCRAHSFTKD